MIAAKRRVGSWMLQKLLVRLTLFSALQSYRLTNAVLIVSNRSNDLFFLHNIFKREGQTKNLYISKSIPYEANSDMDAMTVNIFLKKRRRILKLFFRACNSYMIC